MSFLSNIEPEKIDMTDVYNETDVQKQLILEAKKVLARKQRNQMEDMRDTNYYGVLVFGNENDKNQFLAHLKKTVTVEGKTFIDGYEFAESIGIKIQCSATLPEPHYVQRLKVKKMATASRGRGRVRGAIRRVAGAVRRFFGR